MEIVTGVLIVVIASLVLPIGDLAVPLFERLLQFVGRFFELKTTLEGKADVAPLTIGTQGKALTKLRPAGMAQLDGKRVDVVASAGFIDAGHEVRVSRVEGDGVYVDPVSSDSITDGRPT